MKSIYIVALLALPALSLQAHAERTVSYARANQNVNLDLEWHADNYGSIQWQTSTDGGATWADVDGSTRQSSDVMMLEGKIVEK